MFYLGQWGQAIGKLVLMLLVCPVVPIVALVLACILGDNGSVLSIYLYISLFLKKSPLYLL